MNLRVARRRAKRQESDQDIYGEEAGSIGAFLLEQMLIGGIVATVIFVTEVAVVSAHNILRYLTTSRVEEIILIY